jgi:hypothetical protein
MAFAATPPEVPVKEKIVERVVRRAGVPDLVEVLSRRLGRPALQSLLLEVARRRASEVTPARLLERYEGDRFVRPSTVDVRKLLEFDRLAYALLPPGFEPLELSPARHGLRTRADRPGQSRGNDAQHRGLLRLDQPTGARVCGPTRETNCGIPLGGFGY